MAIKLLTYIPLLIIISVFTAVQAYAQIDTRDTTRSKLLIVEYAENQVVESTDQDTVWYLNGKVRMFHDSTFVYCDTAQAHIDRFLAWGNTALLKADTLKLFSDTLRFNTETELAKARKNVVLQNGAALLYSHSLMFDGMTDIASYADTAYMKNGSFKLKSKEGYYNTKTNYAAFRHHVSIEDGSVRIKTDSLNYTVNTSRATFLSPVLYKDGKTRLYAQNGWYNTNKKQGVFSDNVEVIDADTRIVAQDLTIEKNGERFVFSGNVSYVYEGGAGTADTLIFDKTANQLTLTGNVESQNSDGNRVSGDEIRIDRATQDIEILGQSAIHTENADIQSKYSKRNRRDSTVFFNQQVIIEDTINNISLFGGQGLLFEKENRFVLSDTGKQVMAVQQMGDSDLIILSDSMNIKQKQEVDTFVVFNAKQNVSLFHDEFDGIASDLRYDGLDSLIVLNGQPYIWTDSVRYHSDSFALHIVDSKISEIHFLNNLDILSDNRDGVFNRISGKEGIAYFDTDGNIERLSVTGDSKVVYFMEDELGAYVGLNETQGVDMTIYFTEGGIDKISFVDEENSTVTPMDKIDKKVLIEMHKMWYSQRRPSSKILNPYRKLLARTEADSDRK